MEPGKIVFTGKSKSGLTIIIRYPHKDDVASMLDYINTLSREETFILMQGNQMTLEEEQKFLEAKLKSIQEKKSVFLLAFHGETLIGSTGVDMGPHALAHVGEVGISIAQKYRGDGIGKMLMKVLLEEAEKEISQLRIFKLDFFATNPAARTLYTSFGFQEYGRVPEGLLRKGEYVDQICMYKKIR